MQILFINFFEYDIFDFLSLCDIIFLFEMNQNLASTYPSIVSSTQQHQAPYLRMNDQIHSNTSPQNPYFLYRFRSLSPSSHNQDYSYQSQYNIWQNIRIIRKISSTVMIENWLYIFLAMLAMRASIFAFLVLVQALIFTFFSLKKTQRSEATDQSLGNCRKILVAFIGVYVGYAIIQTIVLANAKSTILFPKTPEQDPNEGYLSYIIIYESITTFIFLLPKIIVLACTNDKLPLMYQPQPFVPINRAYPNSNNNSQWGQELTTFRQVSADNSQGGSMGQLRQGETN